MKTLNLNLKRTLGLAFSLTAFFAMASPVLAYGPVLSVNNTGSNTSITVSGASPYGSIQLASTPPGSSLPTTISNFGATDGNGYFTISVSSSSYGISNGASVYVTVGGQQSNVVNVGAIGGCTYNCGNPYGLSLSQTSVNLSVGQTAFVTAYNYSGGNLYVSSNNNPSAVSASVNGSRIDFYGLTPGNSTVSVCSNYSGYSSGNCANVYVTVGGGIGGGNVWFSPSSPTLYVGQSLAISINSSVGSSYSPYYSNAYYIFSNSNPSAVSANLSGAVLNLQALQAGSASISVCHGSLNFCATLFVTVSGGASGGSLSLSQTSVNVSVGQTVSITAYNYSAGNLYVSSNSNSSVVSPTVSGNRINFYGLNSGSSTVNICASYNSCANVYVRVGNVLGATTYAVSIRDNYFSPNSLTIPAGSSVVWTNSGSMPHAVTADDNSFTSGALNFGNNFTRVFNSPGTYYYHCIFHGASGNVGMAGVIYVTGPGSSSGNLTFSQSNVNLNINQNTSISIYGGYSGSPYYISSNTNSNVVSASVSGNLLYLSAGNIGSSAINVCQSGNAYCGNVYVTVGGYSSGAGGGNVLGASIYPNGRLINDGGTIYIIYKNTKTAFASVSVFNALGYNISNVVYGSNYGFMDSGYVIRNPNAPHPWGSWIKSGSTVYFVYESGLIPVPNYSAFISNGGNDSLVVAANIYDFQLPMLSLMTANDYRLR